MCHAVTPLNINVHSKHLDTLHLSVGPPHALIDCMTRKQTRNWFQRQLTLAQGDTAISAGLAHVDAIMMVLDNGALQAHLSRLSKGGY